MGLIELLIAMVILNIGLFAVVSVFGGATTAVGRAATISSATAVADKQLEIYRSLENCAIWLDTSTASFPAKGAADHIYHYEVDTTSYTDTNMADPVTGAPLPPAPVAFLDKNAGPAALADAQQATNAATVSTGDWAGDIPTFCNPTPGVTPPTYGSWEKQVTIVVRDPRSSAKILARETSLFNPLTGSGLPQAQRRRCR